MGLLECVCKIRGDGERGGGAGVGGSAHSKTLLAKGKRRRGRPSKYTLQCDLEVKAEFYDMISWFHKTNVCKQVSIE